MALVRLNRLNRLVLVALSVGVVAVAVRRPTLGPLATLPSERARYGALAAVWLGGVALVLLWQRTLWVTMGSGAGFRTESGVGPFLRLPTLQSSVREHTVMADVHREGWSPLAGMRVSTALDIPEPKVAAELEVSGARDPDGRVLFESPEGDRKYVLHGGSGNLEELFTTEFKAELIEVGTPGRIDVDGKHVHYTVPHLRFDADCLAECATTVVRTAEQAETASKDTRRV